MRGNRKLILSVVLIAGALLAYSQVRAISLRGLLGLDNDDTPVAANVKTGPVPSSEKKDPPSKNPDWGKQASGDKELSLSFGDIQRIFANINQKERNLLLHDPDKFKQFINQQAGGLSVLEAAKANHLDKDPNTAFLMKLSADNVLRETFLNKLIASKFPAGFPSEKQVKEYYDKNKDKFYLGERVHVWQIFLKTDPDMNKEQIAAIEKRMKKIRRAILDKKIDFADAAFRYSDNGPSKVTGGYMGLIKVSQLKPAMSKVLMKLPEGKLSEPVKDDAGIHILKRGAIIPKQEVSFNEVKPQIHDLLVKEQKARLRKAIYKAAEKKYPVDLQGGKIEEWRKQLLK